MHEYVEEAFDNGCFVLLSVDTSDNPILRWRIQVTKLPAAHTELARGELEDLNEEVSLKNDNRPAARFLYFHFFMTRLRNRRDRQPGWEKLSAELLAGELNAAEEVRFLGGQWGKTVVEERKLTDVGVTEVARRVFEAHEPEDEEEVVESSEEDDA